MICKACNYEYHRGWHPERGDDFETGDKEFVCLDMVAIEKYPKPYCYPVKYRLYICPNCGTVRAES